jgi:hypothetical protein
LDGGDGAAARIGDAALLRAATLEAGQGAGGDGEGGAAEVVVVSHAVAQGEGEAEYPLAKRDGRQHGVDEVGGALGHAAAAAAGAEAATFAGEGDEVVAVVVVAVDAGEAAAEIAAGEERRSSFATKRGTPWPAAVRAVSRKRPRWRDKTRCRTVASAERGS